MTQRTIAPTDSDWTLQDIVDAIATDEEAVIVARDGEPIAAVVPYADLLELQRLRQERERSAALKEYRALRSRVARKNLGLDEAQADDLSNRSSHDLIDDLASEGTLRFARDRR
jgi:PHD/YefM family antitoxin component YafN of YafNO toxin-antitoxin module